VRRFAYEPPHLSEIFMGLVGEPIDGGRVPTAAEAGG
jgi:hypothetical protein